MKLSPTTTCKAKRDKLLRLEPVQRLQNNEIKKENAQFMLSFEWLQMNMDFNMLKILGA